MEQLKSPCTALQDFGYKSLEEYAVGAVESNMTFISWGGHTNKPVMSSSSAKELLEAVKYCLINNDTCIE